LFAERDKAARVGQEDKRRCVAAEQRAQAARDEFVADYRAETLEQQATDVLSG